MNIENGHFNKDSFWKLPFSTGNPIDNGQFQKEFRLKMAISIIILIENLHFNGGS